MGHRARHRSHAPEFPTPCAWNGPACLARAFTCALEGAKRANVGSRPRPEPMPNWDRRQTRTRRFERPSPGYEGVSRARGEILAAQRGEVKAALGRPCRCVWCRFHAATAMSDNPSAWTKSLCLRRLPKATKKSPAYFEIPWRALLTFRAIDGFGDRGVYYRTIGALLSDRYYLPFSGCSGCVGSPLRSGWPW